MAKIALRAYHREIEGLIESNQSEEALAHCRYILQTYPKYLETYRLMGKVFLENQRYGEASDVFQRVLSSIPDDFVSHVGMSIIREDEGNVDAAIWHMERSFEVQPYNSAIQGELRRLYGRRDGLEPSKVRLTRGALARMYLKGGLYHQAIAELRAAMAEDNQRPDLQVLLASAYFQAGQRVEAVEASSSLLKKFPYCFEANRILACILPETERANDSEIYRQRVIALEPYYINLKLSTPTADSVPDQAVVMDRYVWQVGDKSTDVDASQPSWARDIGVSFKDKEELPDWLTEGEETKAELETSSVTPQTSPFSWDQVSEESIESVEMSNEEIPDWMRDVGWAPSTGEFKEGPVDFETSLAGETPSAEGELAPADIPDWLKDMAPEGALNEGEPLQEDLPIREETIPWLEESAPSEGDTVANWLEELGGQSSDTTDQKPAEMGIIPDWLQELSPTPTEGETVSPIPPSEMPDWLQGLAPQETQAGAEAELGELPDWMQEIERPSAPSATESTPFETTLPGGLLSDEIQEEPISPAEKAELPDWLQMLGAEDAISSPITQQPEGLSDWLTSPDSETGKSWLDEFSDTEEKSGELAATGVLPDWLTSPETSGTAPELPAETPVAELPDFANEEAAMAWLEGLAAKQDVSDAELFTDVETLPESATSEPTATSAEIPDWLLEVSAEIPADAVESPAVPMTTETESTEEIPQWLTTTDSGAEQPSGVTGFLESIFPSSTPSAESSIQEQVPELDEAAALLWLDNLEMEGVSDSALLSGSDEQTETPSEELPDWLQKTMAEEAEAPSAELPPTAEALPDWLTQFETEAEALEVPQVEEPAAETSALPVAEEPTLPEATPAPAMEMPDLSDEAAAMAWLESLAAKQGISEDELFSAPEERPATTPAWIEQDAAQAIAQVAEEPAAPAEALPDWLTQLEAEAEALEVPQVEEPAAEFPTLPVAEEPVTPEAVATSALEMPDLSDEATAMAWLESLAAKQGISEDELFSTPEERPATTPAWIEQDAAQASAQLAEEPAAPAEALPDWLTQLETEAEALEVPQVEEPAAETSALPVAEEPILPEATPTPAMEMPDLSDEASAMAWLESLAAKQGISEDELFSAPEERPATTPAWIEQDAAQAIAQVAEEPAAPAEALPDWLTQLEAEAETVEAPQVEEPAVEFPTLPAAEEPVTPEAVATSAMEMPDLSDEAAAMAWLESLAAKQGISEDELFSTPEERPATTPAWIEQDAAQATAQLAEEPAAPAEALPDWLTQIEAEQAEQPEPAISAEERVEVSQISAAPAFTETEAPIIYQELPDWLASIQEEADQEEGAIGAEMVSQWISGAAEEPAVKVSESAAEKALPDWQMATQVTTRAELDQELAAQQAQKPTPPPAALDTRLDVNIASLVELEALPGIGFILAQNIINYRETYGAFTSLEDLQKVSGVGPATVEELRQWLRVVPPKTKSQPSAASPIIGGALEEARVHLAQNDPTRASQIYSQLLRSGHPVGEIVSDLQNALYRYPVDISLWQNLGEAYLLNDQLEDALEAYTKAEELLR